MRRDVNKKHLSPSSLVYPSGSERRYITDEREGERWEGEGEGIMKEEVEIIYDAFRELKLFPLRLFLDVFYTSRRLVFASFQHLTNTCTF